MHGYLPDQTAMNAAFLIQGDTVSHRDLGVVDMRQLAPTFARILGIEFPSAKLPPLPVF
jgi:hypothetical protein